MVRKIGRTGSKALAYVEDGRVNLIPGKYTNTYRHWMETAKDWCISRQLWWGSKFPHGHCPTGTLLWLLTPGKRYNRPERSAAESRRPGTGPRCGRHVVFFLVMADFCFDPENRDILNEKETGTFTTIILPMTWLRHLISYFSGWLGWSWPVIFSAGKSPLQNVYLTGMVRDKQGRKMSKSLGNSPDPIELMDKYGADGVRMELDVVHLGR